MVRTASEFRGGLGSGAGRWPARLLISEVGLEVVRAVSRAASEFRGGFGSGAGKWPARLLKSEVGLEVVRASGPHGF